MFVVTAGIVDVGSAIFVLLFVDADGRGAVCSFVVSSVLLTGVVLY